MIGNDFEYDGMRLSDFGYMICSFNGVNSENVSEGSVITFNTVPTMSGKKYLLSSTKYEECIQIEFDICKINCNENSDSYITIDEQRDLMLWLNRRKFLKFRIISEEYDDIYFNGSFNIDKIELGNFVIGMHLKLKTNSPFGWTDAVFNFNGNNNGYTIYDTSDEIGTSYLDISVTCHQSGDLVITNLYNNSSSVVRNCSEGETITINNMIISSSLSEHELTIMNDFNYIFPMIYNDYENRKNVYTFSIPCSVVFKYNPLRKVGI